MIKKSRSLYVRTSLTIFIALFIFMSFAAIVIFQYLMQPIAKQAAGDLAALMVLSSQTWVELSADARPRFELELKNYHNLLITPEKKNFKIFYHNRPFPNFLKQALEGRLQKPIKFYKNVQADEFIWVEIPLEKKSIQMGFPYDHIGASPPKVIFLLLLGAAALIFLTSSFLVRRLIQPLEKLSQATLQMGRGRQVSPLPETGAEEMVMLTRSFNQMNQRVQQLLDNRNTLLAGISHDLRTPISRIHLALELIEAKNDADLITGIYDDLDEINQLIGQTLELAINHEKAHARLELTDLNALISTEVEKFRKEYEPINWQADVTCPVLISRSAMQRIVQNIIKNSIRYGENSTIDIKLICKQNKIQLFISDQGPGIPEKYKSDVFEPFFRLESSRNVATGGSGLGLAIVKQLCELYDWTIAILPAFNQPADNQPAGVTFCLTIKS